VTLSPEQPEAEFNLVLPPKAGFLEIHLTNRKTGRVIEAVHVTLMGADDPKKQIFSMSGFSTHAILMPPDKDLLLHVTSGVLSNGRRVLEMECQSAYTQAAVWHWM